MIIRDAEQSDLPAIVELMREFAEFEELIRYFEATEEKLGKALFGEGSFAESLVADDDGRIVAYAIFFPYLATFRAQRGYYLEDIYITVDYRDRGIGETLLRRIARRGKSRGFERIDFQVLEWNAPAIAFYEKFGAVRDDVERHFRFIGESFQNLAADDAD